MLLSLTQGHQHGISIPSASSRETGLISDQLLAKALFPAWVRVSIVGVAFCDYLRHKAESQPDCLHTYYTGICLFL